MGTYISSYALCPFYHKEDGQKLYCEGVVDGTSIHLAFGSARVCREYKGEFCRAHYKECRIARMLYQKWEEEDG